MEEICRGLIQAGMDENTPAAVLEKELRQDKEGLSAHLPGFGRMQKHFRCRRLRSFLWEKSVHCLKNLTG